MRLCGQYTSLSWKGHTSPGAGPGDAEPCGDKTRVRRWLGLTRGRRCRMEQNDQVCKVWMNGCYDEQRFWSSKGMIERTGYSG